MSKLPAILFYPSDWLSDDVARCSLAAQGLWLRIMILAHSSKQYGYLSQNGSPIPPESIARACGCASVAEYETLLSELDRAGVPSRTPKGTLFSRRMVRDAKTRAARRECGKLGGNPKLSSKILLNQKVNRQVNRQVNQKHEYETEDTSRVLTEDFKQLLDNSEFSAAWEDWKKHRSEIRKPLKPTTMRGQLKKLSEWGPSRATAALRFSISQGWTGIFEETPVQRSTAGRRIDGSDKEVFAREAAQQELLDSSEVPI